MRGCLEGLASQAHSGHSLTRLVSCLERPGHHAQILALALYLTMSWWPSCSFSSVSAWSALRTTVLWPYTSSQPPSGRSPHASQYGLSDGLIWFLLGHPSQQYLTTCWYVGSKDGVFFCTFRCWSLAGKWEIVAIMQNSAGSYWVKVSSEISSWIRNLNSMAAV